VTIHMIAEKNFRSLLHADGPDPALADKLKLYGWLVGSWTMDVILHDPHGNRSTGAGEIHVGWVLGGRAIQDIWVSPRFDSGQPARMFGTTLRIYDPVIDAWHILWNDPVKNYHSRQTGRADGPDIVQIGTDGPGDRVRWRFTEIRTDSFHWIGERAASGCTMWRTEVEFFASRAGF
jgi:hypothetical protein